MTQQSDPLVQAVGQEVSQALGNLAPLFKPGVRLTFVARRPECPDGSQDMVITDDDLFDVMKALKLRQMAKAGEAEDPGEEPDGATLIAIERARQCIEEGWTPQHDDGHTAGELAKAAACYATPPDARTDVYGFLWPETWDAPTWWKPTPDDRIRELVKAGALIAAEIDRLRRLAAK